MSAPLTAHARVTSRICSDTKCNTPATPWLGPVTPGSSLGSLDCPHRPTPATPWLGPVTPCSSLGSLDCPHRPTLVFLRALYPHSCAPGNNFSVGHPSSNHSRPSTLNLEFFSDELPEKKVYLVDMSILSILLSPGPGYHMNLLRSLPTEGIELGWRYGGQENCTRVCGGAAGQDRRRAH
jgi:hypothetical protein